MQDCNHLGRNVSQKVENRKKVKFRTSIDLYTCTTLHGLDGQHQDVDRTLRGRVDQNDRGQGYVEKVRPWCGQPSDRGRLKNRTEQNYHANWKHGSYIFSLESCVLLCRQTRLGNCRYGMLPVRRCLDVRVGHFTVYYTLARTWIVNSKT